MVHPLSLSSMCTGIGANVQLTIGQFTQPSPLAVTMASCTVWPLTCQTQQQWEAKAFCECNAYVC